MRTLCDYLAVLGLLTETAERYALTPDSQAFLNKKSPAYVGTALDFLLSPPQVDPFQDVAAAVRNGGAVTGQGVIAPAHPVGVTFARAMAPLMALPAERLADVLAVEQDTQAYVVTVTSVPWCTCLWFVVYCASSTGQRSSIRSTLRTSRRSSLVDAGSRPDLCKAQRPACSLEIGARLEERGMLAVLPAGLKHTALNVYRLGQLLACLFKANLNRSLAP
jgi:hypothetical protein